jgi:hypothetical protein
VILVATYDLILFWTSLENGLPYISEHVVNTCKIPVISVNMSVKASAISIIMVLDFFFDPKNIMQQIVLKISPDITKNITIPK